MQIFIKSQDLTQTLIPSSPSQTLISLLPNPNPNFYITSNGKPLSLSTKISQIPQNSTLSLHFRLSGGGGDGGSTCAESRDCYLNMYAEKKPDKIDLNEKRLSKWLNCAISNEPLKNPIVIDKLGNIYNKEKLVEAILLKNLPKELNYIKGLKDMINVELGFVNGDKGKFGCPVSDLEFNGKYGFFALRGCGHVFSEKAFKLVKSDKCLVCYKAFKEDDKIVINGSEDEVRVLRERMVSEKKGKYLAKKVDKDKVFLKNDEIVGNVDDEDVCEKKVKILMKNGGEKLGFDEKVDFSEKDKILVSGNEDEVSEKKEKNLSKVDKKVLSGKKHGFDEKSVVDKKAKKKFKAVEALPAGATKEVYASIFTSSRKSDFKETYSCRSLPLGRN